MRDYVVYHNTDGMEYSIIDNHQEGADYGFVTNKDISSLKNRDEVNVIWMIEGRGKPRRYYLCQRFKVDPDSVDMHDDEDWEYEASGQSNEGEYYGKSIPLKKCKWFPDFLRRMANFSRGFTELEPSDRKNFIAEIGRHGYSAELRTRKTKKSTVSVATGPRRLVQSEHVPVAGQGYGDAETNKEVDFAAMDCVEKIYKDEGWYVERKCNEKNLGYDFLCKKKHVENHVEVKGCRGTKEEFFLKASQKRAAETDPCFILAIVTFALTNPDTNFYTGPELLRDFALIPSEYRASPKEKQSVRRRGDHHAPR